MKRLAAIFVLFLFSTALYSQILPYPSKPIHIVVPSTPGGAADIVARTFSKFADFDVVVENRPTGAGIVATQYVASSTPDGYTVLVTFDTFASTPLVFKSKTWDATRDFYSVMKVCSYPQVLLVRPELGVASFKEFISFAKKNNLFYGTSGPASSSRLGFELLQSVSGIQLTPVNYKGGAAPVQALMSGEVSAVFIQGGGSVPEYVKAGRLLPLAASKHSKLYPDVPLVSKTYPKFETESWVGIFVPKNTPKERVAALNFILSETMDKVSVREQLTNQGCEIIASSPDELAKTVVKDQKKWARLIKERNIVAE